MRFLLIFALIASFAASAMAQQPAAPATPSAAPFIISVGGGAGQGNASTAIQLVVLMTVLTLAPSIVMLMTSFTRIVIVLGFVIGAGLSLAGKRAPPAGTRSLS